MTQPLVRPGGGPSFEPKRGRPSASQSAAIERAIRTAAIEAVLEAGFDSTSMEAIAIRAGVPKSTLYKRFPDKRALLRTVLRDRMQHWALRDGGTDRSDGLEAQLKQLAGAILRHALTPDVQAFWHLASAAWPGTPQAQERLDAIGYTAMTGEVERVIREQGAQAGIAVRNANQVATALMAMLGGWIVHIGPCAQQPEREAQPFADACVDLLMQGTAAW